MTAVSCGLAGVTRATYALAPALDSSRNAVTTVPAGIDASAKSKNPDFNPVVERYAADKHISVDMAAQRMDREYELTQFADRHRKDEAYAGFKITATSEAPTGVLATTTGELPADIPKRSQVSAIRAHFSESASRSLTEAVDREVKKSVRSDLIGATYDPFKDALVFHVSATAPFPEVSLASTPDLVALLDRQIDSLGLGSVAPSTLITERVARTDFTFGGKQISVNHPFLYFFTSSGHCTSSFGVSVSGIGGYLTAAHCGAGSSSTTVNGQTVSYMTSIQWGVYSDRQVAVAAGASWLVHTEYTDEDMAAVPTHIYQGTYYCFYGAQSNLQRCGSIQGVNHPISGKIYGQDATNYGTWNGQERRAGDSGGPVWQPRPSLESVPAGTIEGGSGFMGGLGTCYFLALDDQMAGANFTLL